MASSDNSEHPDRVIDFSKLRRIGELFRRILGLCENEDHRERSINHPNDKQGKASMTDEAKPISMANLKRKYAVNAKVAKEITTAIKNKTSPDLGTSDGYSLKINEAIVVERYKLERKLSTMPLKKPGRHAKLSADDDSQNADVARARIATAALERYPELRSKMLAARRQYEKLAAQVAEVEKLAGIVVSAIDQAGEK